MNADFIRTSGILVNVMQLKNIFGGNISNYTLPYQLGLNHK